MPANHELLARITGRCLAQNQLSTQKALSGTESNLLTLQQPPLAQPVVHGLHVLTPVNSNPAIVAKFIAASRSRSVNASQPTHHR